MKQLYIVPTPIGNLADATYRSIEVLKSVRLIAAEDTRTTRVFLKHYGIDKPVISYHEHNELAKLDRIFEALGSGDVALVSDAGTPGISDPGFKLVKEAIKRDVKIIPLPGASAVLPAIVGSGLPTDAFVFLGFLPKKSAGRVKLFGEYKDRRETLVFYESPYRLVEALSDALGVLGERNVCVARELTKKFESFHRMSMTEAVEFFGENQLPGEMVVVIEGVGKEVAVWDKARVGKALVEEMSSGNGLSVAAKSVAQMSGWKKSSVYELGLESMNKKE